MGVKIRERKLASGEVAFYIDVYHGKYGRFSVKTGIQGNPKNRKATYGDGDLGIPMAIDEAIRDFELFIDEHKKRAEPG